MFHLPTDKLEIWKRAMDLCADVYAFTSALPDSERFGLISQMRRAAVSIPSNVAEGNQRSTARDFASFISIAQGSLAELETQVLIVGRLGFCTEEKCKEVAAHTRELARMLYTFRRRLITSH